MPTKDELSDLLDSDRDKHIVLLQEIVRTASANPPGDTTAAISAVGQFLLQEGIGFEIEGPLQDAPNLLSSFSASDELGGRRLVLNGHIDHFPVNDAPGWQRDPYSGDVDGSFVYGRGVVDMKAGTVASILAFTYLFRFRDRLRGRCTLAVVSDEETGGKWGTKYLLDDPVLAQRWGGDCVLNAEPSGMQSIRFGEKGTLRITFTVQSPGGHGAYTHRDEGSIRIASRLISRLVSLEDLQGEGMDPELRGYLHRDDVRAVADQIMGSGAADSLLKPTVNIGTIRGGAKVNMIAAECVFEADIRLPIGLDHSTVLGKIDGIMRDFPQAQYDVQQAASNPYNTCAHDHAMVSLIANNAAAVSKDRPAPLKPLALAGLGATDCKHYRYRNIPAYSYGPSPETMAARDERVSLEEFLDLVKVHTLAAWDYLGGTA